MSSSAFSTAADADTTALEREIDRHAYALYDPPPDEIKIVEESSK